MIDSFDQSKVHSIVYYVSGHGFGHATRSAAVMEMLRNFRPEIPVHIRTWASPAIFQEMCPGIPVTHCQFDIGVVQRDGITMDIPKTLKNAQIVFDKADQSLDDELEFLRTLNPGCIVSDIPPLAHRAANCLDIPSLTVTNFTWDWIYEDWAKLYPEAGYLAERIRADYRRSDCLLRLPYAGDLPALTACIDIPMLGRRAKIKRDEVRRRLGLGTEQRPLVLLSFGGMGLCTDDSKSLTWPKEFCFLTTFPVSDPSVFFLKTLQHFDIQYPDLVGAVDAVITKPGYGIVSECAVNRTRLLYTERGPFREYFAILSELDQWNCAGYISRDRLLNGQCKQELESLMNSDPHSAPRASEAANANGAEIVAEHILEHYDHKRTNR